MPRKKNPKQNSGWNSVSIDGRQFQDQHSTSATTALEQQSFNSALEMFQDIFQPRTSEQLKDLYEHLDRLSPEAVKNAALMAVQSKLSAPPVDPTTTTVENPPIVPLSASSDSATSASVNEGNTALPASEDRSAPHAPTPPEPGEDTTLSAAPLTASSQRTNPASEDSATSSPSPPEQGDSLTSTTTATTTATTTSTTNTTPTTFGFDPPAASGPTLPPAPLQASEVSGDSRSRAGGKAHHRAADEAPQRGNNQPQPSQQKLAQMQLQQVQQLAEAEDRKKRDGAQRRAEANERKRMETQQREMAEQQRQRKTAEDRRKISQHRVEPPPEKLQHDYADNSTQYPDRVMQLRNNMIKEGVDPDIYLVPITLYGSSEHSSESTRTFRWRQQADGRNVFAQNLPRSVAVLLPSTLHAGDPKSTRFYIGPALAEARERPLDSHEQAWRDYYNTRAPTRTQRQDPPMSQHKTPWALKNDHRHHLDDPHQYHTQASHERRSEPNRRYDSRGAAERDDGHDDYHHQHHRVQPRSEFEDQYKHYSEESYSKSSKRFDDYDSHERDPRDNGHYEPPRSFGPPRSHHGSADSQPYSRQQPPDHASGARYND
jgi:hypothetical protein